MTDLIDRANSNAQAWLERQIHALHHDATDDTECIDCDEPIGEKRKQAVPWAVRCIKCQTALEEKR